MKAQGFWNNNKGKIGITLGVAALGALSYLLYRRLTYKQTPRQTTVPLSSTDTRSKSGSDNSSQMSDIGIQPYDKKFARIINQCRAIYDANKYQLTPEVIKAIIRGQYQLANQDIKALVYIVRRQRREKFDDHLQYAKLVTKYQYDLQQLQEKHLGAILARFNIDKVEWKDAYNRWQMTSAEGNEGLSQLIKQQQQKQLLSFRNINTKPKPYLALQQILRFKIKNLQVLNPSQLGLDLAIDNASKYDLIETYINDVVFNKFNTEEEDIEYSISQLSSFDLSKIADLEDEIGAFMEKFIQQQELNEQQNEFY